MKKLLVVEDDLISQNLMRKIFRNEYEVDTCDSSEEFFEKYSGQNYNVMIIDISLRGKLDGLELIKKVKSLSLYKQTKIICVTANAQIQMKKTSADSDIDLFFTKPVSNKVLKEAVTSLAS